MANGSEQATPMDSIKDVVRSSVKVTSSITPEEGQRTYRLKCCGNNNKDEDNSSKKKLNDKNHQALSQIFRQLTSSWYSKHVQKFKLSK